MQDVAIEGVAQSSFLAKNLALAGAPPELGLGRSEGLLLPQLISTTTGVGDLGGRPGRRSSRPGKSRISRDDKAGAKPRPTDAVLADAP